MPAGRVALWVGLAVCLLGRFAVAQVPAAMAGPMLSQGIVQLRGGPIALDLVRSSGTAARLTTSDDPAFDYTQGDRLVERSADTFYHLGDLDLRLRSHGETAWQDYSTAYRRQPVRVLEQDTTHFVADLAPSLPPEIPQRSEGCEAVPHKRKATGLSNVRGGLQHARKPYR